MVKVRVTDKGVISEPGSGFEAAPTGFPVHNKVATFTLLATEAGVIQMSSSAGVLTGTMPDVNNCMGLTFLFKSTSPAAHVLTASSGDGNVFSSRAGVNVAANIYTGSHGSKLAFPSVSGSSVYVVSDGSHWLILGGSGSFVLTAEAV